MLHMNMKGIRLMNKFIYLDPEKSNTKQDRGKEKVRD